MRRNPTRAVKVGSVTIGGGAPVVVQSMCATRTQDIDATVEQAEAIRAAGAGVVRLAVDNLGDADALADIRRRGEVVWRTKLSSGERWMCHSLANLEHHHFKHAAHRRPGDAHVHFLGADAFSFRDTIRLEDADEMSISFTGFGRPLVNPIRIDGSPQKLVTVKVL